jgi:hypothetical protein
VVKDIVVVVEFWRDRSSRRRRARARNPNVTLTIYAMRAI